MYVTKRDGSKEEVSFDKVTRRLQKLSDGSEYKHSKLKVNFIAVAQQVISMIYDGVSSSELDELSAQICASKITEDPDYGMLASRLVISNHQKKTSPSFSETITKLYNNTDVDGNNVPLVSKEIYDITMQNEEKINSVIDYDLDFELTYFGFKTLEKSYLFRTSTRQILERPQHMYMRVALGIHGDDIKDAIQCYRNLAFHYCTHATPTLFNAGTQRPQLASCFLLAMKSDSIQGIFKTLSDCAEISKFAGGIGLHIHNIRATGSLIRGTNGTSNGIIPMLRVFNDTARYVDQCFVHGTPVMTNSGFKSIESIIPGDEIFNASGKLDTVYQAYHSKYSGMIVSIRSEYGIGADSVTAEHPFLVMNKSNFQGTMEYISAKNLCYDDYIGYPIPNVIEKDIPFLTDNDLIMVGIILGSGKISIGSISCRKVLLNSFDIDAYLADYLIQAYDRSSNNEDLVFDIPNGFPITRGMIYEGNNKLLQPNFVNLPLDKLKHVLLGFVGSCSTGLTTNHFDQSNIEIKPSGSFLNDGLRLALLRFETLMSNNAIQKSPFIVELLKSNFRLSLSDDFKLEPIQNIVKDNIIFAKITELSCYNVEDISVIDLKMQNIDSPSYVTNSGIVHNGGGKRNGSFAIYLEPWHLDIEDFLDLKINHGDENARARDLFYGLWVPNLFMERVEKNEDWTLFCPDRCQGLSDCYGKAFNDLYTSYEERNRQAIAEGKPKLGKNSEGAEDLETDCDFTD